MFLKKSDGVNLQLISILTVAMTTFSSYRRTVFEDKLLTQEITGIEMKAVTLHPLKMQGKVLIHSLLVSKGQDG